MISDVVKSIGIVFSAAVIIMRIENFYFLITYILNERKISECRQIIYFQEE